MNDDMTTLTDTRDMVCVHHVFRRAFADATGQIASVEDGDAGRAQTVAGYLGEVLWFPHAHHGGEDDLLYPLLVERAPEARETFSRMASQHLAVAASIEAAEQAVEPLERSGSAKDGRALSAACRSVLDEVAVHLEEEEAEVLPVAARTATPAEWGALPKDVLSRYEGARPWLLLGLVFEAMPDELREKVLANVPPTVAEMWFGFGADAFERVMATIRTGAT